MKKMVASVVCVFAAVAAFGVQKWTYEGTTLTEIVTEGATPWKFTVNASGALTGCSQGGDSTVLDLREETLPEGLTISSWTWNTSAASEKAKTANVTALYFPDSITSIGNMGIYCWASLAELALPENLASIGNYCFEGCPVVELVIPESLKKISDYAFNKMLALMRITLPSKLESIGASAFNGCTALETIEPCVPGSVTNFGTGAFSGCSKLTGPVEIGFGTNDITGEPLMVRFAESGADRNSSLFNGCTVLKSVKYGPGVTIVPRYSIMNCKALETIEVGPNVTTFRECFNNMGVSSISNIIFRSTGVTTFTENTFSGVSSTLRDVSMNGWYEAATGKTPFMWGAKKVRLSVPGDNTEWVNFVNNAANVTPWENLSASVQAEYTSRFGSDAETPFGLSTGNTGGMAQTWIVVRAVEIDGAKLQIGDFSASFGTVTVDPAPRADGLYEDGTTVTVTFTPAEGVTFLSWQANVELTDPTALEQEVTLHTGDIIVMTPSVVSPTYNFDGTTLSDGAHIIRVTGDRSALTVSGSTTINPNLTLDLSKPIDGGGAIVAIGASAFYNNAALTSLVLPEGLTTLGNNAFNGCSSLTNVVNLIPDSVTTIGQAVFKGCTLLASPAKVGFGTDEEGKPLGVRIDQSSSADLNSNLFGDCAKIPSLRWGPGVVTVPRFATYNMTSLGYLELGVNVLTNREYADDWNSLTNVMILATNDIYLSDARVSNAEFAGGKLREIEMHCWFGVRAGYSPFSWNAKQVRMIVPGGNANWAAFMADSAKVTPWADVSDDYKTAYTNRYGEAATEPVGVTVANASVIPGGTWIVSDGSTLPGFVLTVVAVPSDFGTLTVDPAPPESGLYEPETEVAVTFAPADGVTFLGWSGESDSKELSVAVTMDDNKSLSANFWSSFWVYREGTLSDGQWTLVASGAADAITAGKPMENKSDGWLDLTKPIKGGGTIVGIAPGNGMDFSKTTLKRVSLPETLQVLGQQTFDCCRSITNITPFLPRNLTTIGLSAVVGNWALKGDLEIGCGVDAQGDPIPVAMGERLFLDSSKIGPTVRLGRGVSSVKANTFCGCTGVKNLVFEGDMPEIDRGAFNCAADQMRIYTSYESAKRQPKWAAYFENAACVTPWDKLSAEVRAAYWAKYPHAEGNRHPYGLTLTPEDTSVNALPGGQWVFKGKRVGTLFLVR